MSRYYEGRFNTGMYVIYRTGTGKYLGTVMNCHSESEAIRKAECVYGKDIYVSEIEE